MKYITDWSHNAGRERWHRKKKRTVWYDKPQDFPEDITTEALDISKEYTFKLLSYLDHEDDLTEEELTKMRAIFAFSKHGPRAWTHRFDRSCKLVSADVLYILTSKLSSYTLAKKFKIDARKIREIRSNERNSYNWEYELVKRLVAAVKDRIREGYKARRQLYIVNKLIDPITNQLEPLFYTQNRRRAEDLRKESFSKKEYDRLTKNGELDILYPITSSRLL